jgi:hypothetical protein
MTICFGRVEHYSNLRFFATTRKARLHLFLDDRRLASEARSQTIGPTGQSDGLVVFHFSMSFGLFFFHHFLMLYS